MQKKPEVNCGSIPLRRGDSRLGRVPSHQMPEFWKNVERGKFYKLTKTSTTVHIDPDVLAWLRSQGKDTSHASMQFCVEKC